MSDISVEFKTQTILVEFPRVAGGGDGGGSVAWDDVTGKPSTFTPSAHTHQIAEVTGLQARLDEADGTKLNQATIKLVRKSTAGTITKGQVVYIVGSQGTHLTVELADADSEATAATTVGVALGTITDSAEGFIIVQGLLEGLSNLPTASFTNGAALWLSQTAGGWTTTRPTQPAHGVFLGWVVSASNGAAGRAYVKVINGQELEELHDVLITSPTDGQILTYEFATGLWKNVNGTTLFAPLSHGHTIGQVTGLQTALDGKAAASHGHSIADVSGLQTALDGKAASVHSHAIGDVSGLQTALDAKAGASHAANHVTGGSDKIRDASASQDGLMTASQASKLDGIQPGAEVNVNADWNAFTGDAAILNKPASFPPSVHGHAISDVTGLQTALDGKAATSHTHAIADVTGLQTALDGKAATSHSHSISDVTGLQTALDAKQKTITSGTAAPSGGADGDFYFQYT